MDEILRSLAPGSRVLDLGALTGSFGKECCPGGLVVRVDLEMPAPGTCEGFVQADAARLPFPDHSFDAIISNHSLEHIHGLGAALKEMGRVVRPEGSLYVAVPDGCSFADRLFRWVYREEAGHVNLFCSAKKLAESITKATGLELRSVRTLNCSFEYLNRYYFGNRAPWQLWLTGNGKRWSVVLLSYLTRLFDRAFGTRASVYGWALYFGNISEKLVQETWSNVCAGCGSGHPAGWLVQVGAVRRHLRVFGSYRCPRCGSWNFFTSDEQADA